MGGLRERCRREARRSQPILAGAPAVSDPWKVASIAACWLGSMDNSAVRAAAAAAACAEAPRGTRSWKRYGVNIRSIALTASYTASCVIAKVRVGWMVAGWAPGTRSSCKRAWFHLIT